MNTSVTTTMLAQRLLDVPTGAAASLVFVNRYGQPGPLGIHLIYALDEPEMDGHFTVGLFETLDAVHALDRFGLLERVIFPMPFMVHGDALRAYIRSRVIPLEWKSLSDVQLDDRLVIISLDPAVVVQAMGTAAAILEESNGTAAGAAFTEATQ